MRSYRQRCRSQVFQSIGLVLKKTADADFAGPTAAQESNVFQRQAEARLQLRVIKIDEPPADAFLARIVPGPNKSANESRTGLGKGR